MINLVFFVEELSAKVMLEILLPKIINLDVYSYQIITFQGKQDLEKQLPLKLRAWLNPNETRFIILRDKDSGDCKLIKNTLRNICEQAGKSNVLIRIACHELESFYLGDLAAVGLAFDLPNLKNKQQKSKFRTPDELNNPVQELQRLVPEYEKVSGSRKIAQYMDINNNTSTSFNYLIQGIKQLIS